MSPEKTQELCDRFPKLFLGMEKPITQSLMAFGFECGDGWFDIISELCQKIDELAKAAGLTGDDYPEAMQVKEKYGGLRFYLGHGTDEIFAAIDKAEAKSVKTCETCGKPGRQVGCGWVVTICEACEKKKKEDAYIS
jgi:hypothetical protein